MGRFVNPDNSAFQAAINSQIYVDKTGLIEYTNRVLGSTDAYICSSRPRRFGKSYAANMLSAYYSKGSCSETLFSGLDISRQKDFYTHLNRYALIHIDVQWFLANCPDRSQIVRFIQESVIEELRREYVGKLPENDLTLAQCLSLIREKTEERFVIIIDEWDVLIRERAVSPHVQNKYIEFLRGLFKGTEPTRYIQLAYLTGILPIRKERTQSALNNFDEFTMISAGPIAPFMGFTEEEVRGLAGAYGRDFTQIKRWYDGYLLKGEQIYNPRAVISLLLRGEYRSYWSDTASYETIVPLINMDYDGLKQSVIEMLSGVPVPVNVQLFPNDVDSVSSRDDVLTYMIHLGYLGYDAQNGTAYVPNEEIRMELKAAVTSRKWAEMIRLYEESSALLAATLDKDEKTVARKIGEIHDTFVPAIQYNNEISLGSVLMFAYLSALDYYFKPMRELPAGRGFADVVFLPKPENKAQYPAILMELKWDVDAKTALDQIRSKQYPASLRQYTGQILLVGINYDRRTKEHTCLIRTDVAP